MTLVSELKDAQLDLWVAKAEGLAVELWDIDDEQICTEWIDHGSNPSGETGDHYAYSPSTDWSQGGPIIEREGIEIKKDIEHLNLARINGYAPDLVMPGDTPLIAAMRCHVASKFGDTVSDG